MVPIRPTVWRSVALLAVGAAFGATVIAPVSAHPAGHSAVVSVVTHTRSASCAGLDFHPTDSHTGYSNHGPLRFRSATSASSEGTGVFQCDPGVPNGAVVTKVQFTVSDVDGINAVTSCEYVRSGLSVSGATTVQVLANAGRTGFVPGTRRLTDKTIVHATIDNSAYGYWLECLLNQITISGAPRSGIYGADVIYRITDANG